MYTVDELRETAKEYRPPVYLTDIWYYAILEIDGYVRVKDGEIVPSTLNGFPTTVDATNIKKFTRSEVIADFTKWKLRMEEEELYVPDGRHPVGRLFMRPVQAYTVPNGSVELPGQKRFYDGLLKVLVGRRVAKWSPEDAIEAWNARRFLEEKTVRLSRLPNDVLPLVLASH